jgi:predicted lipid-binding transport protein (Tim44 family)
MRKLLIIAFAALLGLSLGAQDSDAAKRLGGGQSIGKQRESIQREAAPRPPVQGPAAAPHNAPAQRPGWGGPLAGLLAGGLLGALLFGGAFDGINFADVALLALLLGGGWLLLRSLARGRAPARTALEGASGPGVAAPTAGFGRAESGLPPPTPETPTRRIPADFDEAAFLSEARKAFVRLQTANDAGDVEAIRDYTTPELYATLESQIRARGSANQNVAVTTLNAELLEVATEGGLAVASVLFSGFIRESDEAVPERFEEIWHVVKDPTDRKSSWLVAGIQQTS